MPSVDVPAPRPLRVDFVGPMMDLVLAAYRPSLEARGHAPDYVDNIQALRCRHPLPDVVVISPLVTTENGLEGACAAHSVISERTLLVAMIMSLDHSHTQYVQHALGGRCHRRTLIHYPQRSLSADDVVTHIDREARRSTPRQRTTAALPSSLISRSRVDLGQILLEDPAFARLVHAASTHDRWCTAKDLASLLDIAEGTAKNIKSRLGRRLAEEHCIPGDVKWTSQHFVRFVTENRAFIRGFVPIHRSGSPPGALHRGDAQGDDGSPTNPHTMGPNILIR